MTPRLLARFLVSCAAVLPSVAIRPSAVDLGKLAELEAAVTPVADRATGVAKRRSAGGVAWEAPGVQRQVGGRSRGRSGGGAV